MSNSLDWGTLIPGTYIDLNADNALQGIRVGRRVCCFVGEIGTVGQGSATKVNTVYPISSVKQAEELFGADSNIVAQFRPAFSVFSGGIYLATALENTTNFVALFTALEGHRVDILSFPYPVNGTDNATGRALIEYLDRVSNPTNQNPAIAVTAHIGNLTGTSDIGINHRRITFVNAKNLDNEDCDDGCDYGREEICGAVAAMILSRPDPARSFNNFRLPLRGTSGYLRTDINALLTRGITPLNLNADRGLSVVRLVSTETDGVSEQLPDMWIRSFDFIREAVRNEIEHCFTAAKLTNESVGNVRSVILGCLKKLEDEQIVKNVDAHVPNLIVEPNPNNLGFLTVRIPADIVIPLHGAIGYIDLIVG
jgi:phage tail sheath gpL-like